MEQIEVMSEEAWSSLSDMYAKEDNEFLALLLSGCSSPTDLSMSGTTTGFWASDQETSSLVHSSEFCNSDEYRVSQEASLSPDDDQIDLYLGGSFFHSDNVPECFLKHGGRSTVGDFHYDFSPSMGNYTAVPSSGRCLFDKYDFSACRRFEKQALDQSLEVTFPNLPERKKRCRNAADVTRSKKYMKSNESQKSNVSENDTAIISSPVSVLTQTHEYIKKETHNNNGTKRASNGKGKTSKGSSSGDPQSLYARVRKASFSKTYYSQSKTFYIEPDGDKYCDLLQKRRERINQRLRILQGLVPNGTKVDISTMLEEAVHYVKFLQLQIKLLSSDETWMYAPLAYNGMDIGISNFDTTSLT